MAVGRVRRALAELADAGVEVDTLAIAPRGEATLDRNLGWLLDALRPLGLELVVFTNGTLLHRDDVRRELRGADEVIIDVDAADAATWRDLHHPTAEPSYALVHQGLRIFPASFTGRIATVSTLVGGVHDSASKLTAMAELCAELKAQHAYVLASDDEPSSVARRQKAAELFADHVPRVLRTDPLVAAVGRVTVTEPAGARQGLRAARPVEVAAQTA